MAIVYSSSIPFYLIKTNQYKTHTISKSDLLSIIRPTKIHIPIHNAVLPSAWLSDKHFILFVTFLIIHADFFLYKIGKYEYDCIDTVRKKSL